MVVKKIDQKETIAFKKINSLYLDKRSGIMRNNQFKIVYVFDSILSKNTFSAEQITKLDRFSAEMLVVNIHFIIKI